MFLSCKLCVSLEQSQAFKLVAGFLFVSIAAMFQYTLQSALDVNGLGYHPLPHARPGDNVVKEHWEVWTDKVTRRRSLWRVTTLLSGWMIWFLSNV